MRFKPTFFLSAISVATVFGLTASMAPASAVILPGAPSVRQLAPSWVKSASIYEVNVRQFSQDGTFNAVTAALPRIKALGVGAIWLMPVTPVGKLNAKGSLGSPYSVANYTAVNPDYGTDTDFKNLVDTAHSLGLKVVLDWVADHSAWDNPWITAHPDWYVHDSNGNITWPVGTDWTDVAQLDYSNTALHQGMIDAMKYWVTNFDIDGYRCDAAGMVPTSFWNEATAAVNSVKPLWWLAEDQSGGDLLQQAFSTDYNWNLLHALNSVGNKAGIAMAVSSSRDDYRSGTYPMNFITNHDENSWSGTEFERLGNAVQLSAAIAYLTPGIPLIYNGQEIGMNHRLQFFEKDPISWGQDPAASEWTTFYSRLNRLRSNNAALWSSATSGKLSFLSIGNPRVLGFGRYIAGNRVFGIFNMGANAAKFTVKVPAMLAGRYVSFQNGRHYRLASGQKLVVSIPAWGYYLYSTAPAK
ncbi:MAG: alpha-amylase family glycosyl hydrolase [Micrococcales bacterium]